MLCGISLFASFFIVAKPLCRLAAQNLLCSASKPLNSTAVQNRCCAKSPCKNALLKPLCSSRRTVVKKKRCAKPLCNNRYPISLCKLAVRTALQNCCAYRCCSKSLGRAAVRTAVQNRCDIAAQNRLREIAVHKSCAKPLCEQNHYCGKSAGKTVFWNRCAKSLVLTALQKIAARNR